MKNFALSHQSYTDLTKGEYFSQMSTFPRNDGSIDVAMHMELANSDRLHYHGVTHLTFILNGGVVDKRKRCNEVRRAGDTMFFHAGEPHQTIGQTFPTKYVSLTFDADFLKRHEIDEGQLELLIEKNPNSKFILMKLYSEFFIKKDEFTNESANILLNNLIEPYKEFENTRPVWLEKVDEILRDDWDKNISLDDLALAAGVHPKTISKYFPRYFACTLAEYRRQLKVEKSLSLIRGSKLSLTDIAYECGFCDQSHFIRTFKQLNGFSPKVFQKI